MIDYAQAEYEQIEAKAAELARQFWAEIEEGLAQQSSAPSAATYDARQKYTDVFESSNLPGAALRRNTRA